MGGSCTGCDQGAVQLLVGDDDQWEGVGDVQLLVGDVISGSVVGSCTVQWLVM